MCSFRSGACPHCSHWQSHLVLHNFEPDWGRVPTEAADPVEWDTSPTNSISIGHRGWHRPCQEAHMRPASMHLLPDAYALNYWWLACWCLYPLILSAMPGWYLGHLEVEERADWEGGTQTSESVLAHHLGHFFSWLRCKALTVCCTVPLIVSRRNT